MLEGTTLSEGRGTTRPLEVLGAPDLDVPALLDRDAARSPRRGSRGCRLRPCWFEPTFNKHVGKPLRRRAGARRRRRGYYDHEAFRPWRLFALAFKALRRAARRLPAVARIFPTSTSSDRLAIDVINGSELLRQLGGRSGRRRPRTWSSSPAADEAAWRAERRTVLLY